MKTPLQIEVERVEDRHKGEKIKRLPYYHQSFGSVLLATPEETKWLRSIANLGNDVSFERKYLTRIANLNGFRNKDIKEFMGISDYQYTLRIKSNFRKMYYEFINTIKAMKHSEKIGAIK